MTLEDMLDVVETEVSSVLQDMGAPPAPCWLPEEARVEVDLARCPEVDLEKFMDALQRRIYRRGEVLEVWGLDGRTVAVSEPEEDRP